MKLRDGDKDFDSLAILDALYAPPRALSSPEERADKWNLLWNDLIDKTKTLDEGLRKKILAAGLATRMPREFSPGGWRPMLDEAANLGATKLQADVMIFCVIEEEFNATLAAFGINQSRKNYTVTVTGHKFYRLLIQSRNCKELTVWIGLIGEARNVVCANFCRDIFEKFEVKRCCILVGIAGGNKEKVKLGDVVAAEEVIDIEGGRVETRVTKPRHKSFTLSTTIQPLIQGFAPHRWGWLDDREKGLQLLSNTGVKILPTNVKKAPKYKLGIILAGEKLRRDGKLPSMAKRYGDKIMAVEMEGSGFAAACRQKSVDWLIFRGISDYGDPKKSDTWQPIAAFHAALAAKSFIIDELRPAEEVKF